MKKHDKVFKKYLIVLTFLLCAFGLFAGITEAANKTSKLTKGQTEEVITDDVIEDYIVRKIADALSAKLEQTYNYNNI